jgi:outer membrane protein assembly factor BamB
MKSFRWVLAALVVCGCSSNTATPQGADGASWTIFRGPDGLGIAKDKGVPTSWSGSENIVWRVDLPGAGTSSPIVVGPRIYLTAYSGFNVPGKPGGTMNDLRLHLVCIDRGKGTILWTKDIAPRLPEQERIREGHGYASSTLACDGERLFAFFGATGAFAFDLEGNKLWQKDLGTQLNGYGSANSPVLFEDLVIFNASVESGCLVALDKKSGTEKWRAKGIRESWNTPVLVPGLGGKKELVVGMIQKVLGFDPRTGEQLWSCGNDIGWYIVPGIVHDGKNIYSLGGRSGTAGVAVRLGGRGDVTRTHRLWTSNKGSNVTSPVVYEGHLYWMNDNLGIAYCAECETGKLKYEQRIQGAGQVYASPVLIDGKIYYFSRTGRAFIVAAKPEFELIASNDFGERSMFNASPAVADGRLYVRSDRSLWCVGKK